MREEKNTHRHIHTLQLHRKQNREKIIIAVRSVQFFFVTNLDAIAFTRCAYKSKRLHTQNNDASERKHTKQRLDERIRVGEERERVSSGL